MQHQQSRDEAKPKKLHDMVLTITNRYIFMKNLKILDQIYHKIFKLYEALWFNTGIMDWSSFMASNITPCFFTIFTKGENFHI